MGRGKRDAFNGVGGDICGGVYGILELLEFWKIEFLWLWRKERNKGRGKEIIMRRYFLLERKLEIIEVADSRDSVADAEIFRENTGIVRNSSISERPEINIKNP